MSEAVSAFHDLDAPPTDELVRCKPVDPLAPVFDGALGDIAALCSQQVGYGLEGRRLAGTIRPQKSGDAALRDFERDALQYQDDVVIDDLDIVHREHRPGCWSDSVNHMTRSAPEACSSRHIPPLPVRAWAAPPPSSVRTNRRSASTACRPIPAHKLHGDHCGPRR